MRVRRVITGTGPDGRSFIAGDDMVEPVTTAALPGYAWHRLWGLDDPPADPLPTSTPNGLAHFPPPGGVRFNLFTVPPASTVRPPLTDDLERELERKLPGRSQHMESDQAGMHRTASVDLIYVLSGRVSLELDDGTVNLTAGDTLVQNGTRHAWRNPSDEPCVLAIVLIGARSVATPGSFIQGFDWMLSSTPEFDSTVAFYRDVLGLELTEQGVARTDTQFARYACAPLPAGGTLEVVEPNESASGIRGRQILCLRVRDLLEAKAQLDARGAVFTTRIFNNGEGLGWIYLQAPGGNIYQIYGPIPHQADASTGTSTC